MFTSRSRGRDGGNGSVSKVGLKGLFADGIWHCNCEPRLPAEHFQTKNGGPNHGRWFYTCQKGQPLRCNFFLWDEEAKPREATVVMNNTRSEIHTPTKQPNRGALTPNQGWVKIPTHQPNTPYTPSKPPRNPQFTAGLDASSDEEEFYDWPDSGDDELAKAVEKAVEKVSMPPPETPRKAVKMNTLSTPGTGNQTYDQVAYPTPTEKRTYDQVAYPTPIGKRTFDQVAYPTPKKDTDDVFSTPSTSIKGRGLFSTTGLLSPEVTPSTQRMRDIPGPELTNEIIDCLQNAHVQLSIDVIASVKDICKRHTMRTEGIIRGRDVTRKSLTEKEGIISELQNRNATLEEEKEMMKMAMRELRRDLREATANDNDLYTQ